MARQIVEVAKRMDDPIYSLVGFRTLGEGQFFTGQLREALNTLQIAERYRDPIPQRRLSYRFSVDPGVLLLQYKVFALRYLGLNDQAARVVGKCTGNLRTTTLEGTIAFSGLIFVRSAYLLGDFDDFERESGEFLADCVEKELVRYRLLAFILHAKLARCACHRTII